MRFSRLQFVILYLTFITPVMGQVINREELDEAALGNLSTPPAVRLLDLGEVFDGQSDDREKLVRKLDALKSEHDFSVYFIAYSGIIGSNVVEKAEQFRDDWLGSEEEGLIFVCDTDMKNMAYALTKIDGLPLGEKSHYWKLADHEAISAVQSLSEVAQDAGTEQEYLTAVGQALVNELEQRLDAKKEEQTAHITGLLTAFVLTAVLIFVGIWWIQRKWQMSAGVSAPSFPEIRMSERLGAHYGGGVVGEVAYRPPSHTP